MCTYWDIYFYIDVHIYLYSYNMIPTYRPTSLFFFLSLILMNMALWAPNIAKFQWIQWPKFAQETDLVKHLGDARQVLADLQEAEWLGDASQPWWFHRLNGYCLWIICWTGRMIFWWLWLFRGSEAINCRFLFWNVRSEIHGDDPYRVFFVDEGTDWSGLDP